MLGCSPSGKIFRAVAGMMGQLRTKLVAFLPHRNAAFYGKLESGRVASVFPSPRWVPLLVSHGVKRLFHGILKAELVCVRMKTFIHLQKSSIFLVHCVL